MKLDVGTLAEFRARVGHKEEIREIDLGRGLVTFCYMIAAESTFDDAWSRECRGIVFDTTTGGVVARPLHKFFNVNERPATHIDALDWSRVSRVMDKRDGSMIHTVAVNNGVSFRFKSKKSIESDVARAAWAWANASSAGERILALCDEAVHQGMTAIFEWTAPTARIVLPYTEPALHLLHIRENLTGRYLSRPDLAVFSAGFKVPLVEEFDGYGSFAELVERAGVAEGIEGWVVQMDDGEMVKLKTAWYLKRHRAMTFLRERDIAQLVLDEGLDDLKSMLVGDGVDIEPILTVENRVLTELREIASTVESDYLADASLDRKSFAIKHKQHPYFGLLMSRYSGKEPPFKDHFGRHLLRERYGLEPLNLVETVAEIE